MNLKIILLFLLIGSTLGSNIFPLINSDDEYLPKSSVIYLIDSIKELREDIVDLIDEYDELTIEEIDGKVSLLKRKLNLLLRDYNLYSIADKKLIDKIKQDVENFIASQNEIKSKGLLKDILDKTSTKSLIYESNLNSDEVFSLKSFRHKYGEVVAGVVISIGILVSLCYISSLIPPGYFY